MLYFFPQVSLFYASLHVCWIIFVVFCIEASLLFNFSGVYSAAHDLKMEWVVIKGISGYPDGTEAEENWKTFASVMAASVVISIVNDCSIFEDWPHYKGKEISFNVCFRFTVCLHTVTRSFLLFRFVLYECSGTALPKNSTKLN